MPNPATNPYSVYELWLYITFFWDKTNSMPAGGIGSELRGLYPIWISLVYEFQICVDLYIVYNWAAA